MNLDLSPPLDVTSFRQTGKELVDIIYKEVKHWNESVIYMPLPSKIVMTQAQYDDLNRLSGFVDAFHSDDKLFKTPYNIMEVRVEKRTKLTFEETQKLDEKSFIEWEKSEGME